MHNAFMRAVAGRLESRYQYSSSVVYNNFPFPALPPETTESGQAHRAAIEATAQAVLDGREAERDRIRRINAARAAEPGFTPLPEPTLASLYHPDTMSWNSPKNVHLHAEGYLFSCVLLQTHGQPSTR